MGWSTGGGDGGGSLSVPSDFIFADTITRDDYFATNPSKLRKDIYVSVAGELQQYDGSAFISVAAVIKGQPGQSAPQMLIQYSATGDSAWSNTLNVAIHKYWRWSTDNGVTWSANFVKFSGSSSSSGVPEPYSMVVGGNGKLQLFKNGELIQEQDETGAWISNSVSTGTGSLHIGDLHSNGSAGENVVWVNTDSNLAWYPDWAAVSLDGQSVIDATTRVHGSTRLTSEPVGEVAASGEIEYNFNLTVPANVVFFFVDIVPAENYTGRLKWYCEKASGKEVASFFFDGVATIGQVMTVPFKYPLWATNGQQFNLRIEKPDGSALKVRPSLTQPTQPYRKTYYRTFTDEKVFHAGNAIEQATALNALTGADRLSAAAIRDFPVMSDSVLGLAKLGSTMQIDVDGKLNTAVSPTGIKIVADQAARLAIPQSGGAILAIQQDNGFTYGIEANQDTTVNTNWKQIGTVATNVVSFNGRNGAVTPATGDYNQKQIKTIHDDTSAEGFFGIDNTGIYWDDGV